MKALTALNIAVGIGAYIALASIAPPANASPICRPFLNLPFWTCSQELSTGGGQGGDFSHFGKETRTTKNEHPNCGGGYGGDPGTHPGPHGPEGNGHHDHGGDHPDHDHGTGGGGGSPDGAGRSSVRS